MLKREIINSGLATVVIITEGGKVRYESYSNTSGEKHTVSAERSKRKIGSKLEEQVTLFSKSCVGCGKLTIYQNLKQHVTKYYGSGFVPALRPLNSLQNVLFYEKLAKKYLFPPVEEVNELAFCWGSKKFYIVANDEVKTNLTDEEFAILVEKG